MEGPSQIEEQDLKEKIASWDPSQEDGYGLSMADGIFEIAVQEEASAPTQASDIDKSNTVFVGAPRSCNSSRKNATETNPYESMQWLTEDYDNLPLESRLHKDHVVNKNEYLCTLDTQGVIVAIDSATEALTSVLTFPRKPPTAKPCRLAAQATTDSVVEPPLSASVSRAAPTRSEQSSKPGFFEISLELSQDVDEPNNNRREDMPVASSTQDSVVSTAANAKENRNIDLARVDPSSCKDSGGPYDQVKMFSANDNTFGPSVVNAEVGRTERKSDLCADSKGEMSKPVRSVASRKEDLARLVDSLRLVDDVPGVSWDISPLTSTKGSALTAREFDRDDITVTDNGDISICIRMSTRRKSAMLWPFGPASLNQSPTSPQ